MFVQIDEVVLIRKYSSTQVCILFKAYGPDTDNSHVFTLSDLCSPAHFIRLFMGFVSTQNRNNQNNRNNRNI